MVGIHLEFGGGVLGDILENIRDGDDVHIGGGGDGVAHRASAAAAATNQTHADGIIRRGVGGQDEWEIGQDRRPGRGRGSAFDETPAVHRGGRIAFALFVHGIYRFVGGLIRF